MSSAFLSKTCGLGQSVRVVYEVERKAYGYRNTSPSHL